MKSICIDIDGTICTYSKWIDSTTFGEVLPGAQEYIAQLKTDGWFIIIYSTRTGKDEIANFLNGNHILYDAINENPYQPENAKGGKPMADIYLDDRAITFRGDWKEAYKQIVSFKPWEDE